MNIAVELQTSIPGYETIVELETNETYTYYQAVDQTSKRPVLIKKLVKDYLDAQDIATVTHEFNLTKNLHLNGILIPIRLENYWNKPYLICESFEGISLSTYMKNHQTNIKQFLQIAIKLTSIIDELHQSHIIHKNIQPDNILFSEEMSEFKLTGFYHASKLRRENHRSHVNPYTLGKQISYISPEQTGRINRFLDSRTDLYSLGIVLYELLTGRLPFSIEDPIELVHAHIAKKPVPPDEIDSSIPHLLSTIIMKLLSKMPELRYQSALGLKSDLIKFENEWLNQGKIPDFRLAKKDRPQIFHIEDKLYGRDEELKTFISAFDNVCKGQCSFVLIPGVSGIGKTALVNEVQKPLVRNKGYFISGKFDQLKRDAPYEPLVNAFQDLLKQLMAEGEKSIEYWKIRLESELGPYLPAIAQMIPAIKWIVGDVAPADSLPAIESHTRLRYGFLGLIHLFSNQQHPLVLFLDDLQWADHATLDLLRIYFIAGKSKIFICDWCLSR